MADKSSSGRAAMPVMIPIPVAIVVNENDAVEGLSPCNIYKSEGDDEENDEGNDEKNNN